MHQHRDLSGTDDLSESGDLFPGADLRAYAYLCAWERDLREPDNMSGTDHLPHHHV